MNSYQSDKNHALSHPWDTSILSIQWTETVTLQVKFMIVIILHTILQNLTTYLFQ